MRKTYLLVMFSVLSLGLFAQEATVSSGGEASGVGGAVSFSVGQVSYSNQNGSNGSVEEGVQQVFDISVITGVELNSIKLSLSAYPNPTTDFLTLEVNDGELEGLGFELLELTGKSIRKGQLTAIRTNVAMNQLPESIYLLKINDNNKVVKTFKIIKK